MHHLIDLHKHEISFNEVYIDREQQIKGFRNGCWMLILLPSHSSSISIGQKRWTHNRTWTNKILHLTMHTWNHAKYPFPVLYFSDLDGDINTLLPFLTTQEFSKACLRATVSTMISFSAEIEISTISNFYCWKSISPQWNVFLPLLQHCSGKWNL